MPKTKKKWIDNKNAETFRLVHRSQRDPLIVDEKVGEHVLQPVQKKDSEEHLKFGVYYDDDYNYLQHMKTVNEATQLEGEERVIIRAPKGKLNLPSTLFETAGLELTSSCSSSASPLSSRARPGVDLDDEVMEALEGKAEFGNDLEDDFVVMANGGELPPQAPPQPIIASNNINTNNNNTNNNNNSNSNNNSDNNNSNNNNNNPNPNGNKGDHYSDDGRSFVVEFPTGEFDSDSDSSDSYESSSSEDDDSHAGEVLRGGTDGGGGNVTNRRFERLYAEGAAASDEDEDDNNENMLEPDSFRMRELVDEHRANQQDGGLVLGDDGLARRYLYTIESGDEAEETDEESIECPDKKKWKWDCETVLTAYSNTYNHPTVIQEARQTRAIRSNQQSNNGTDGVGVGLAQQGQGQGAEQQVPEPEQNLVEEDDRMECDPIDVRTAQLVQGGGGKSPQSSTPSIRSISTARSRQETTEEKKLRKKIVKEARAERRVEKKANKMAFNMARKHLGRSNNSKDGGSGGGGGTRAGTGGSGTGSCHGGIKITRIV